MIEYRTGDILREDVVALVNTVNCVGVMGRGLALQFKRCFPENYRAYAEACKRDAVVPGRMFVYETGRLTNPRFIINFPTKRHWRAKSKIADIEQGLDALVEEIRERHIDSIAVPPLGSGLGGLEWDEVRPLIEAALAQLSDGVRVVVFEPHVDPTDVPKVKRAANVPKMTAGRAALVGLMNRYLAGLLDPFVTLLEVHKLLYFLQAAGEPLKLRFAKGPYGPYAENLPHVLHAIEGHLISGYACGGDAPDKQIELLPGALEGAETFLESQPDTAARFKRVSDLVEGFESPFGLELLATVHWLKGEGTVASRQQLVREVHGWSPRKRRFTERQIGLAAEVLERKGWFAERAAASR